ncbi:recombinase family protein [Candidatus Poribacteria bacterium]|nr:recombinase family protein [Candidatus Poribacteria bacterium]
MRVVAYLRVSTARQDLDPQRLAIWDYAHQHRLTIDEFISAKASSQKGLKPRQINDLLARLQPADVLLVSELSRLGRSVGQIIFIIEKLVAKQVRLVAIKEGIDLAGRADLQTKVMITLFSLFAEIERDLISERTKEGVIAARAKGKVLGRPKGVLGKSKLDGKEEEIRFLLQKGVSKSAIAKILSVPDPTLRHFIKTRRLGETLTEIL